MKITFDSCGGTFTVTVNNDRKVFSWGKGARGRLGHPSDAAIVAHPNEGAFLVL